MQAESKQQALSWSWPVLESVRWNWAILGGLPCRPKALRELSGRWGEGRGRLEGQVEPGHEPPLAGALSVEKEVWTLAQELPEGERCEVTLGRPATLKSGVDAGWGAPLDVPLSDSLDLSLSCSP